MASTPAQTTHALTTAEIGKLLRQYRGQRSEAIEQLNKLEARRGTAAAEPAILNDHDKAVRQEALRLINGYASADWALPKDVTREQELTITIGAIDLVLDALQQRDIAQTAVEAVEWEKRHLPEWRTLCRDLLLCAVKLQSLEAKAAKMKASRGYFSLPCDLYIGSRPILPINWSSEPLGEVLRAAIGEQIVSQRDISEASK